MPRLFIRKEILFPPSSIKQFVSKPAKNLITPLHELEGKGEDGARRCGASHAEGVIFFFFSHGKVEAGSTCKVSRRVARQNAIKKRPCADATDALALARRTRPRMSCRQSLRCASACADLGRHSKDDAGRAILLETVLLKKTLLEIFLTSILIGKICQKVSLSNRLFPIRRVKIVWHENLIRNSS